jgi:hypothetical protein
MKIFLPAYGSAPKKELYEIIAAIEYSSWFSGSEQFQYFSVSVPGILVVPSLAILSYENLSNLRKFL